jgi:hypothetical protein
MKFYTRALSGAGVAIALAIALLNPLAAQQDRVQAGTLNCDISGGLGLIIGSQKDVTCLFVPADASLPQEVYMGTITKFGLDLGATSGGQMVWAVYSPTNREVAALRGEYVGASGEATVGAGLGANVLVGGSNRTIALQPVSIQGQTGLNVAVGVSELRLRRAN